MKRYLTFSGLQHYPCGGWEDFQGSADTVQEALTLLLSVSVLDREWYQIVDSTTGEVVGEQR